jgi:hypothetical protein
VSAHADEAIALEDALLHSGRRFGLHRWKVARQPGLAAGAVAVLVMILDHVESVHFVLIGLRRRPWPCLEAPSVALRSSFRHLIGIPPKKNCERKKGYGY